MRTIARGTWLRLGVREGFHEEVTSWSLRGESFVRQREGGKAFLARGPQMQRVWRWRQWADGGSEMWQLRWIWLRPLRALLVTWTALDFILKAKRELKTFKNRVSWSDVQGWDFFFQIKCGEWTWSYSRDCHSVSSMKGLSCSVLFPIREHFSQPLPQEASHLMCLICAFRYKYMCNICHTCSALCTYRGFPKH